MLNTPGGTGGSLGLYAEPFHDTTNYLTVQPAGSPETIALNTTATRFGLYWGSMDTYNSIQFYRNGGLIDTVTGAQAAAVVPALANGNQADDATNRYIEISAVGDGLGFDTVVLLFKPKFLRSRQPLVGVRPQRRRVCARTDTASRSSTAFHLWTWRPRFLRLLAQKETGFEDGSGLTLSVQPEL